ncbi:conserved hypothetical protein [Vibrio phage 455E52-1]|nr:conserved hypothetical protein [Vibrio phage 455E52-1]
MKHKHYDMIVAKAANVELVVFLENNQGWSEKENQSDIQFHEQFDYFLCLPQHKEACLHWLNGGEVEENYNSRWDKVEQHSWHGQSVFNFDDGYIIRIKPKKEKRWIIWNENQDKYHCTFLTDPDGIYEANFKFSVHEIEVEA